MMKALPVALLLEDVGPDEVDLRASWQQDYGQGKQMSVVVEQRIFRPLRNAVYYQCACCQTGCPGLVKSWCDIETGISVGGIAQDNEGEKYEGSLQKSEL